MSFKNLPDIHCHQCSSLSYDESIDCSNAGRTIYLNRVKQTEEYKDKIEKCCDRNKGNQRKSSMETAMETLGREMASLMEQDLSLMRQLLTMNETLEDIKSKRLYGTFSKYNSPASSYDILDKESGF